MLYGVEVWEVDCCVCLYDQQLWCELVVVLVYFGFGGSGFGWLVFDFDCEGGVGQWLIVGVVQLYGDGQGCGGEGVGCEGQLGQFGEKGEVVWCWYGGGVYGMMIVELVLVYCENCFGFVVCGFGQYQCEVVQCGLGIVGLVWVVQVFDEVVVDLGGLYQGVGLGCFQMWGDVFDEVFFGVLDVGFVYCYWQWLVGVQGCVYVGQGLCVFGEVLVYQYGGFVFSFQVVEYVQQVWQVVGQYCFVEFEDVEVCYVQYCGFDVGQCQFVWWVQQGEFLQFLVGGQQIVFDMVGEEGQCFLIVFVFGNGLILGFELLGQLGWQQVVFDWFYVDGYVVVVQCCELGVGQLGFVQVWQCYQG